MHARSAVAVLVALLAPLAARAGSHAHAAPAADPDRVVRELYKGNKAFAAGAKDPTGDGGPALRKKLCDAQHPKAIVLSCSDSRVPPEHVFRQDLGDLFVTRIAGNVPASGVVASIEYAVEHLQVPVLFVLGHHGCGAVKAAVAQASPATAGHLTPDLTALLGEIAPAVERAKGARDVLAAAIDANVELAAQNLLDRSAVVREAWAAGKLRIVGGVYDFDTGLVKPIELPLRGAPTAAAQAH
jgi:carbonic anhydrase